MIHITHILELPLTKLANYASANYASGYVLREKLYVYV